MGSDADQLVFELVRRTDNGTGEHDGEPASPRSGAVKPMVAVAVGDNDVLGIDLELFRENLGGYCFRAVAPEGRLQSDVDLSRRVHLQRHALRRAGQRETRLLVEHPELSGAENAALLAGGNADADVFAALPRLLLPLPPARVIQ